MGVGKADAVIASPATGKEALFALDFPHNLAADVKMGALGPCEGLGSDSGSDYRVGGLGGDRQALRATDRAFQVAQILAATFSAVGDLRLELRSRGVRNDAIPHTFILPDDGQISNREDRYCFPGELLLSEESAERSGEKAALKKRPFSLSLFRESYSVRVFI